MATEHIVLESDVREVPTLHGARKVHADVEVRSRLRRRFLQLRLIDYYYLSVRSRSSFAELEYVLDLRFADASPGLSRHVAWRWVTASLLLAAVVCGIAARIASSAAPWRQHEWLGLGAAVLAIWAVTTLIAAYRTTATVRLQSAHGRARLLEFTGSIADWRALRQFTARLAAHVRLAAAARRPARGDHLRDELREHQRLRDIGVLTAEDYEASKLLILAQHSHPARARGKRPS